MFILYTYLYTFYILIYILYTFYTYFIHIQMACYIVFGGFHNDFQNNFIRAPLQLASLLSSKKIYKRPGAL